MGGNIVGGKKGKDQFCKRHTSRDLEVKLCRMTRSLPLVTRQMNKIYVTRVTR